MTVYRSRAGPSLKVSESSLSGQVGKFGSSSTTQGPNLSRLRSMRRFGWTVVWVTVIVSPSPTAYSGIENGSPLPGSKGNSQNVSVEGGLALPGTVSQVVVNPPGPASGPVSLMVRTVFPVFVLGGTT